MILNYMGTFKNQLWLHGLKHLTNIDDLELFIMVQ